jgi:GIY-YIG catalytic domain
MRESAPTGLPKNERPPSKQTLRDRIKYHYTGNAEGWTLRKALGCLLADDLGIQLRRVGSGNRMTFVEGALSARMAENDYVSWVIRVDRGSLRLN